MAILASQSKTGVSWVKEALVLFKQSPRKGFLLALPYMGAFVFSPVVLLFWWPIITVFVMRVYRNLALGKSERLAMMLQLIQPSIGKLLMLGLINVIYLLLVSLILRDDLLVMAELVSRQQQQQLTQVQEYALAMKMLPILLKFILSFIPLMIAVWFAPMLIAFNAYSLIKSIKSSIAACIQYLAALTTGWALLSGSIILLFLVVSVFLTMVVLLLPSLIHTLPIVVMFGCLLFSIAISLAFQYICYRDIYRAA